MKARKLQSKFQTRQQMESEDFEIFYYNDSELKTVKSHSHQYYEFYFLIDGKVSMTIKNTKHVLKSCDVIVIPPGTKHHVNILDNNVPYKRIVLWLSENYINSLSSTSSDYLYVIDHVLNHKKFVFSLNIIQFNELRNKLFTIIEEGKSRRFARNTQMVLLINDLILNLNRIVYDSINIPEKVEEYSLYEKLLAYINTHIDENITLDDLANNFFVSKYYISHLFKENTGISLHQYVTKKRLALCRHAIEEGTIPTKAASSFGFKDYSTFYRAFKKEYGFSPNNLING